MFCAPERDSTEIRGLLVAHALLERTAELAQRATIRLLGKRSSSQHVGLLEKLDTRKGSWPVCQTALNLLRSGCLWLLLAAVHQSEAMLTAGFSGQNVVIVNALQ